MKKRRRQNPLVERESVEIHCPYCKDTINRGSPDVVMCVDHKTFHHTDCECPYCGPHKMGQYYVEIEPRPGEEESQPSEEEERLEDLRFQVAGELRDLGDIAGSIFDQISDLHSVIEIDDGQDGALTIEELESLAQRLPNLGTALQAVDELLAELHHLGLH